MFKKTLLALTIAGASLTTNAATVAAGSAVFSTEGVLAAATPTIVIGDTNIGAGITDEAPVNFTSAAAYIANDVLFVTIAGAPINTTLTTAPTLLDAAEENGATAIDASFLDIVGTNVIRFRVDSDIASGEQFFLHGVSLDASNVTNATDITVATKATSINAVIGDYDAGAAVSQATFEAQVSTTVDTLFNGVVDVNLARQGFDDVAVTNGDVDDDGADDLHLTTQDTLEITIVDNGNTQGLTFDGGTIVIQAEDLSAYADQDADEDGTLTAAEMTGEAGITSIDLANNTILTSWAFGDLGAAFEVSLPSVTGDNVLETQTFTAAVSVLDGTDAASGGSAVAAGSWTLNGSVITIPYIPFGPNTQPILRYTNTGAQTGDVTGRYMVEGDTSWTSFSSNLFTAAAPGVRNMLTEVTAALLTAGHDRTVSGFKVALEVTSNVPAADVNVFVGAKLSNAVDQDRLSIGNF